MILFKEAKSLDKYIEDSKKKGLTIGFIPTMGALHSGHLSLVKQGKTACKLTVCSIFVNPTQFNDPKDFEKYPITIENDIRLLEQAGNDVLFLPSVDEVYPAGLISALHYELGYLENILEGFYRPGHFQGVCQVVHTLLNIVKPNAIFMGRKDYQQCMVIKKLIELYHIPTALQIGVTLREPDGLAMSSRNLRLTPGNRPNASAIYQALKHIQLNTGNRPLEVLKREAIELITAAGFAKVDYVEICDAGTLIPMEAVSGITPMVALAAAFLDGVRLIDNMVVYPTEAGGA
jgi:pantoate--beta-alanine ligase